MLSQIKEKDVTFCECGKNEKPLKHFELCDKCGSEAYHVTQRQKPLEEKPKEEENGTAKE